MNQEFQCTKVKDGLYIGNIVAAHDYEFLLCNKFGFVVNCTAEIPNVFEHENIKYIRFKLIQNKSHKLWDQTLKKINKLQKFIEQAEQSSLCCLIHSFHGQNRSLVFVAAYLIKKYQWRLKKCLQYLKSKQIFIGLSNHYISQLQILETLLSKNSILSIAWSSPYIYKEEQILSKTYLNSLQGNERKQYAKQLIQKVNGASQFQQKGRTGNQIFEKKVKSQKRVVWLDRLEKKKLKQEKQKQQQQIILSNEKTHKQLLNRKLHVSQYVKSGSFNVKQYKQKQRLNVLELKNNQFSNKKQKADQQNQELDDKNVYQLTINNFINPNFKIINKTQPLIKKSRKEEKNKTQKSSFKQICEGDKQSKKKRNSNMNKKQGHKMNRAQSQKQVASIKQIKNKEIKFVKQISQSKKQIMQNKKGQDLKERDIKKQLKRQIQKVGKQKSCQSLTALHLVYPFNDLAQQLIKNQQITQNQQDKTHKNRNSNGNIKQQDNGKRSVTPTRRQKRKEIAK